MATRFSVLLCTSLNKPTHFLKLNDFAHPLLRFHAMIQQSYLLLVNSFCEASQFIKSNPSQANSNTGSTDKEGTQD